MRGSARHASSASGDLEHAFYLDRGISWVEVTAKVADCVTRYESEAHFYPPIAKLTGDTQALSDAEIYFIVANGVGYTAMPGFADLHSSSDIWRLVLWVRHLARLTPQEKAAIESEVRKGSAEHEHTMGHEGVR